MPSDPTTEEHYPDDPGIEQAIRARRVEMDASIPDIARRAGVSAQTWRNYESGRTRVRGDKVYGVWTALGWWPESVFDGLTTSSSAWTDGPDEDGFDPFEDDLAAASLPSWSHAEAQADGSWSPLLSASLGEDCARCFSVGVDLYRGLVGEDVGQLAGMPRGTHLGQLEESWIGGALPHAWTTRYDHEFCYHLLTLAEDFCARLVTHPIGSGDPLVRSVAEELVLHHVLNLGHIVGSSQGHPEADQWEQWFEELAGRPEDIGLLYASNLFPDADSPVHVSHWFDPFSTPHVPTWVTRSDPRDTPLGRGLGLGAGRDGHEGGPGATVTEFPRRLR